MSEPIKAVFLSYARDDAAAARRIAEALRAAGLEVWFDENELRGGDSWDAKIRKQINDCTVFLAVISQHTEARAKGYFRLEWKLAVEQVHMLLEGTAFLVPVVIDDTPESAAAVPAEFLRVQWTRLPDALPTPQFVRQVRQLIESPRGTAAARRTEERRDGGTSAFAKPAEHREEQRRGGRKAGQRWLAVAAVVAAIGVAYIAFRPAPKAPASPAPLSAVGSAKAEAASPAPAAKPPTDFAPAKSVAVLPFANLSTETGNEFFADGVQDDVITNLAKIRELTVISRTSTLAYRDPGARNLRKIAAELGVATVLEGSVRRVGNRVQMNAQLIDARTDTHIWAETFQGDAGDIFALQAKLAQEIAGALKVTLTGSERALIEKRPTQNQAAYDLFVRAKLLHENLTNRATRARWEQVVALYQQAIDADPGFALALVRLTEVHGEMYVVGNLDPSSERRVKARAATDAVDRVAPGSPETHYARGLFAYFCEDDHNRALQEYRLAEAAFPSDSRLLYRMGLAHRRLGQMAEAHEFLRRAAMLNPRDLSAGNQLIVLCFFMRRFAESLEVARKYAELFPSDASFENFRIRSQFALDGNRSALLRATTARPLFDTDPHGLVAAYERAMLARDYAAADRALSDPRLVELPGNYAAAPPEPAALHRAMIGFLAGHSESVRDHAEAAITYYRGRLWTKRTQGHAVIGPARALAYSGRTAEAATLLRSLYASRMEFDPIERARHLYETGRAFCALEMREDAIAVLGELMTGASDWSPNEIRWDPFWARVKDDPRFEEILKSAKPL